jgi:hypothetical protein
VTSCVKIKKKNAFEYCRTTFAVNCPTIDLAA